MTTVTTYKTFPVIAGTPNDGYKLKKVGLKKIAFTYLVHPDGDRQLLKEREVSRKIY